MSIDGTTVLRNNFFKSLVDKIIFRLNLKVEKANNNRVKSNKSYRIDGDILRLKSEQIGVFYYKIYLYMGNDIIFTIWIFENRVDCFSSSSSNLVNLKVDVFNNPLAGDDIYYHIMDNLKVHL